MAAVDANRSLGVDTVGPEQRRMAAMLLDRTVWSLPLFSTVKTTLGYDVWAARQYEQTYCQQKAVVHSIRL